MAYSLIQHQNSNILANHYNQDVAAILGTIIDLNRTFSDLIIQGRTSGPAGFEDNLSQSEKLDSCTALTIACGDQMNGRYCIDLPQCFGLRLCEGFKDRARLQSISFSSLSLILASFVLIVALSTMTVSHPIKLHLRAKDRRFPKAVRVVVTYKLYKSMDLNCEETENDIR